MSARRALYALGACCSALLLILGAAGLTVTGLARSERTYAAAFARYADTAAFAVEADQYPALARALAAYFQGRGDSPQARILRAGEWRDAYNEKELTHLRDVCALLRGVARVSFLALALWALSVGLLTLCGRGAAACRAAFCGGVLALLLVLALLAWVACDFDGAFIAMHRLLFTNDLWLLDPRTDLLIALMPEALFIGLGKRAAAYLLPLAVFLLAALGMLGRKAGQV